MPLYRYTALDGSGKSIKGVIDAVSESVAKESLKREKMWITAISNLPDFRRELALSSQEVLRFTAELGQLLKAGLPLYDSLLTLEEKYRRHKIHPFLLDLSDKLKSGNPLSFALKNYPKSFDSIYICMVEAAEETGSLEATFDQIRELIQNREAMRKQIVSALIYPGVLLAFCFILILSLLLFVIPSMRELFEGRELKPLTQFVLSLSSFATKNILWLTLTMCAALSILFLEKGRAELKKLGQRLSFKLPFFKTVVLKSALIRFARSCSLLLKGGVPLTQALALARKVMDNAPLEAVIERAEKRLTEGKRLSDELKASKLIPPLVTRMLALSEETGKMAPMLGNIAEIYEEELRKDLAQMLVLLQPALLLLLGLVVGVVLLAVLLPLTDVGSLSSL